MHSHRQGTERLDIIDLAQIENNAGDGGNGEQRNIPHHFFRMALRNRRRERTNNIDDEFPARAQRRIEMNRVMNEGP